jgi:hypothetical protein
LFNKVALAPKYGNRVRENNDVAKDYPVRQPLLITALLRNISPSSSRRTEYSFAAAGALLLVTMGFV